MLHLHAMKTDDVLYFHDALSFAHTNTNTF